MKLPNFKINSMKGDTIVEVLVSMSILALVLGAAYATTNRSLRTGTDAGIRSQATSYAQQQIEILKSIALNNPEKIGDYKWPDPFCIDPVSLNRIIDLDDCALPIGSPDPSQPYSVVIRYYPEDDTRPNDPQKTFVVTAKWPSSASAGEESTISLHYKPQDNFVPTSGSTLCPTCTETSPTAPNAPFVSLSASPSSVLPGDTTTLTWTTRFVNNCKAEPNVLNWNGPKTPTSNNATNISGSQSGIGPINSDTTFSIECRRTGVAAAVSASVTVGVQRILTFAPDSASIPYNTATTLRWTTTSNLTSCSRGTAPSGSQSTGNLTTPGDNTFSLTCTGPGGTTPASTTKVTVGNPPLPPTIDYYHTGGYETKIYTDIGVYRELHWSASGPGTNCYVEYVGWVGPSGSRGVTVYPGRNYRLTCSNSGGSVFRDFQFSYQDSYVNLYQHAGFDGNWPGWTRNYDDGDYGGTYDASSLRVLGRAALYDTSGNCYTFTPGDNSTFYGWVEDYGIRNDADRRLVVGKGCNGL